MNVLFLTLRGNVIGDSIRDIALSKKFIDNYSKKYRTEKIFIYYPCSSLIYDLLKDNKYLIPVLIKDFDNLNKNISKLTKLTLTIKGGLRIIKLLENKNITKTVYLGKLYVIRELIAKFISLKLKSEFLKSGFNEAKNHSAELNFNKNEEKKVSKYLKGNKRIAICTEVTERKRDWGIKKYTRLIENLLKNNYLIYLIGIDERHNKDLIKQFSENKNFILLINKITLRETAIIIRESQLFIGNDSGLAHVASAVNTNEIILLNAKTITEKDIYNNKKKSKVKVLYKPTVNEVKKESEEILR